MLSTDIEFLKKISSKPIAEKILNKYLRDSGDSSEQILKSSEEIKIKSESSINKQKQKDKEIIEPLSNE